ncbi:MAG TPA: M20/M25/M40 family metallo-hydrolase [Thermoanaerobaculia bacterium]|nr:M20/M25/M40 family metallo-hydrolase [Thermoanaerobaculia bacterium]
MNRSALAVCALFLCAPALAQEQGLEAIRPEAIRAHMRFLSDDLLEGRDTATRGHELAAKYVATAFESLGLDPAGTGGSFLQTVPLLRTTLVAPECSLTLDREGRKTDRKTELRMGQDFILLPLARAEASVTAPVVFAGFGLTAPEMGYDDYAGIDVRGKIVAILGGAPTSFHPDQQGYYSDRQVTMRNAAARGAIGILWLFWPRLERIAPWEVWLRWHAAPGLAWANEGRPRDTHPGLEGLALLSRKSAEALFAGAPVGLEEIFAAAEAGRSQSFELPVKVTLRTVSRRENAESPNVAAVLRGSDPRLRDEYVLLTAHLDHVGIAEPIDGDAIYNGAYDNASGVAMLLEAAKAFSRLPAPPRRSVLFLAVTGEEKGLQGSSFFARNPTVPASGIVANVNLDMILMLQPLRDVIAYGAEHSSLANAVETAARRFGVEVTSNPVPEQVLFVRSDHYSFVQEGVPSIFLTSGFKAADPAVDLVNTWLRERYHQPDDDMSQAIDFEAGTLFAKLNFLIAWLVAQDDQRPSWNPGDFFGEKFGRKR